MTLNGSRLEHLRWANAVFIYVFIPATPSNNDVSGRFQDNDGFYLFDLNSIVEWLENLYLKLIWFVKIIKIGESFENDLYWQRLTSKLPFEANKLTLI